MWFRVDDKLPQHRKFRALRRLHPKKTRDVTALGLWVIAGAWSEDGFVPLEVMEDWDDDATSLAARLVESGLWVYGDKDGEPGCWFHDWHDMNPSVNLSEKGSEGNHRRWHLNRGVIAPDCHFCRPDIAPDSPPDIAPDSPTESPDPTRPDPIEETRSPADADEHAFDAWWQHYPRKVGKGQARTAYKRATKKTDPSTLLAAVQAFAERTEGSDPKYVPHASTWLNGERWTDQPDQPHTDYSNLTEAEREWYVNNDHAPTPNSGGLTEAELEWEMANR